MENLEFREKQYDLRVQLEIYEDDDGGTRRRRRNWSVEGGVG